MKYSAVLLVGVSLVSAASANADDSFKTGGIGIVVDSPNGQTEVGLVLEGNTISTDTSSESGGISGYGRGNLRLELIHGFGVASVSKSGVNLIRPDGSALQLHAGAELGLDFSANTDDDREDFIEFNPAMSLGLRSNVGDTCNILGLLRGGASAGTLGEGGIRPTAGAGIYAVCPTVAAAGEFTRIFTRTPAGELRPVDVASSDLGIRVGGHTVIGIRGEMISTKDAGTQATDLALGSSSRQEVRGFLTVGGAF